MFVHEAEMHEFQPQQNHNKNFKQATYPRSQQRHAPAPLTAPGPGPAASQIGAETGKTTGRPNLLSTASKPMVAYSKIVVAGGGVIGNSISYYLAKRYSLPCTIIDPVGIAPAASGKAGGFLAQDWSDGSPIQDLQRRSFDLHAEQAEHLGADQIDYRRLECIAVACDDAAGGKPKGKQLEGVEWADLNTLGSRVLGKTETIAQVHPKKLCAAMWTYSQKSVGSKLVIGKVVEAILNDDNSISGV
ncbi:hypothetical protein ACHAWF_002192 [Thalassiosira exigua]